MATFYAQYPASAAGAANASVAPTGAAVPADATYVGGKNGGNLVGIKVESDGTVDVSATGLPTSLGQKVMASSTSVAIASDQSAVPISAASLPLPSGAATEATLSTLNGKVTACNTGAVVVSSSALPTGAATEATLASLDGKVTACNTGAVTISAALPAGANVIGHVIVDGGSTTVVTGNVTVVQPTGTNLHTVIDSGTVTTVSAVTAITNALPAGSNVIGHVIADSGSTTAVTGNVTVVQPTGTNLHTVIDSGTLTTVSTVTAVTSITNTVATKETTAATSTLSNVASSASSVTVLALNTSRLGAMIFNDSTATLYLKFGATASATSYTVQIPPNGYYELPTPHLYTGIMDGIWSAANGNARVTELS